MSLGRCQEALSLLQHNAETLERVLGPGDMHTLNCLFVLSTCLDELSVQQRQLGSAASARLSDEAEISYRKLLECCQTTLGRDHPTTLTAGANLGIFLGSLHRHHQALPFLQEVYDVHLHLKGADHLDTLKSQKDLGSCFWVSGKFSAALPMLKSAADGLQKLLGDEHPLTCSAQECLAGIVGEARMAIALRRDLDRQAALPAAALAAERNG